MKIISNKYFVTSLVFGALVSGGFFLYNNEKPVQPDPLQQLLGFEQSQNNASADFLSVTDLKSINPYSGPKSAALLQCIAESQPSLQEGIVRTKVNATELTKMLQEQQNGTFSREAIRNELMPVFGYAMNRNEINWKWFPATYSYEFYVAPGTESLWKCYFESPTETTFFKRFYSEAAYVSTPNIDTDGDGILDGLDSDDDNDGLLDTYETGKGLHSLLKDTDSDGILDNIEIGANPNAPTDTDGDGIIDALESSTKDTDSDGVKDDKDSQNTNPNNDTDADGFSNADETIAGSDPLDATSKPSASAIIAKIVAYTNDTANPKTKPTPSVVDYTTLGISGVTAANIATVNAAIDAKPGTEVDTVAEIQDVVNAGTDPKPAIIAKIVAYTNDTANPKTAPTPTVADYTTLGITGVTDANIATINAAIDAKPGTEVDTVAEIQAVVTAANNPDRDGDGVLNTEETQLGTNPDLADTDADGKSDGVELKKYTICTYESGKFDSDCLYDPAALKNGVKDVDNDGIIDALDSSTKDTDNDGVNDEHDSKNTDPNNDSDGDGYKNIDEKTSGANPLDANSVPADFDNDKIPDAIDTDDDNDTILDTVEVEKQMNPKNVDSDADGILDTTEGTVDTDNDGKVDAIEKNNNDQDQDEVKDHLDAENTNPNNDSDADGFTNYQEKLAGTNPLDAASKPNFTPVLASAITFTETTDPLRLYIEKAAAELSWNIGTFKGGSAPTTYTVRYGVDEVNLAFSKTLHPGTSAGPWKAIVGGLEYNKTYYFQIFSSYGNSEVKSITTPPPPENGMGLCQYDSDIFALDASGTGGCKYASDAESDFDGDGIMDDVDTDGDGDGILNTREIEIKSYPFNVDSDNDGILDKDEIGNPANPRDTDGDGLLDILESNIVDNDLDGVMNQRDKDNNDPKSDSDGDGVNDIQETIAKSKGFVADPLDATKTPDPTDTDKDGNIDVNDLDDDNDGIEDQYEKAVIYAGNGVQYFTGTDPLVADTDKDGVKDGQEIGLHFSLLVGNFDKDYDGVNNALESNILDADGDGVKDELDPDNDTDGDGFGNELEYTFETHPLDPKSKPSSVPECKYDQGNYNDKCVAQ